MNRSHGKLLYLALTVEVGDIKRHLLDTGKISTEPVSSLFSSEHVLNLNETRSSD